MCFLISKMLHKLQLFGAAFWLRSVPGGIFYACIQIVNFFVISTHLNTTTDYLNQDLKIGWLQSGARYFSKPMRLPKPLPGSSGSRRGQHEHKHLPWLFYQIVKLWSRSRRIKLDAILLTNITRRQTNRVHFVRSIDHQKCQNSNQPNRLNDIR